MGTFPGTALLRNHHLPENTGSLGDGTTDPRLTIGFANDLDLFIRATADNVARLLEVTGAWLSGAAPVR